MENSNKKLNENVGASSILRDYILFPLFVIWLATGFTYWTFKIIQFTNRVIENKIVSTVEDQTSIGRVSKLDTEMYGAISFCVGNGPDCKNEIRYGLVEKLDALEEYLGVEKTDDSNGLKYKKK